MKNILNLFLLISFLSTGLSAQEGYFGKTLGIQGNFIYQRYKAHSLRYLNDLELDQRSLSRFIEPAKLRLLSPEISIAASFSTKYEFIAGFKQKNLPILLMRKTADGLPDDVLNVIMPYGAELKGRGYTPLNSIFAQFNFYLPRQEAPTGSYVSFGLSRDFMNLQNKISTITYNDEDIPLKVRNQVKNSWFSAYVGAGKKFPITKNLLLNVEARWVLNLQAYALNANSNGSSLSIEYDEVENAMYVNPDDENVLIYRTGRLTLMKLNLNIGVQYMIK